MKNIKELNNSNRIIIRIDNSLEKYKSIPVFQDKLDDANVVLKKVGLPDVKGK
jgi:hypothetical protein